MHTPGRFTKRAVYMALCGILVGAPLSWNQYARGYSIPSREPPAIELGNQPPLTVEAASATELEPVRAEPLATPNEFAPASGTDAGQPARDDETIVAQRSIDASLVADQSQGTGTDDVPNTSGQGEAGTAIEGAAPATATVSVEPAAPAPVPLDRTANKQHTLLRSVPAAANPAPGRGTEEQITIVVSEPQAEIAALPEASVAESIQEVVPIPPEVKALPVVPKAKRSIPKPRRSLVMLQEPAQRMRANVRSLEQMAPLPKPDGRTVQPVIGGRGVAAHADLGRASPLSGAAPDVFAAGHHVASAATCGAYADNPYFREDAFGRTLRLSCE